MKKTDVSQVECCNIATCKYDLSNTLCKIVVAKDGSQSEQQGQPGFAQLYAGQGLDHDAQGCSLQDGRLAQGERGGQRGPSGRVLR